MPVYAGCFWLALTAYLVVPRGDATFSNSVLSIVLICTCPQVRWTNALPVITGMADNFIGGYRPDEVLEGFPVGEFFC